MAAPARGHAAALAAGPWAIALFEAQHRVKATLADLHRTLGERDIVIAREVTKRFETIARMPLAEALAWVEGDSDRVRGEFVLLVEGRDPGPRSGGADPRTVLAALLSELPVKQAAALAAKITGARRNDLYAMALEMKDL